MTSRPSRAIARAVGRAILLNLLLFGMCPDGPSEKGRAFLCTSPNGLFALAKGSAFPHGGGRCVNSIYL